MGRLTHPAVDYSPAYDEATEMTLAFIAIDLRSLDRKGVKFSLSDEDALLEIEQLARGLRRKLS